MTLLSVLRNGDSRFLPLLLAKVNDVLPTLVNPMLQTVPETPANICPEVDIFGGYGPMSGIGVPSNFNGLSRSSDSDFKVSSQGEFKMESPGGLPFDKRIEEISSPNTAPEHSVNSPFTSPPIIQQPSIDFPGSGEYGNFADPHGPHTAYHLPSSLGNYGEGVGGGGRQIDIKREFEASLGLLPRHNGVRRPSALRQGSSSGFTMHQMPRSIPEQLHHLQRANSNPDGLEVGIGLQPF